ncbi:glycine zipper family protein [Ruegeria sp. EL01]|jgi:uncharacterized protein YcfJ|uniref:glycine zipper family protein n=1 Tax=Ruegeria sp. EL01 TaxID=2107578 RepID=UPI000EA82F3F|nr:glycine zipper family protein [Ruegeria sp. EL01]
MRTILICCAAATGLTACSNTFEEPLLVDGTKNQNYQSDLQACRSLAVNYGEGDVQSSALGGAAIGGVLGAIDSEDGYRADDALVGAVVGGGLGALEGHNKLDETRRAILLRCMQGRGHRALI